MSHVSKPGSGATKEPLGSADFSVLGWSVQHSCEAPRRLGHLGSHSKRPHSKHYSSVSNLRFESIPVFCGGAGAN